MPDELGKPTDRTYVESHESEYISPIDAIRSKAMAAVFKSVPGLEAQGIDDATITKAAVFMADKAAKEYEDKKGEDVLCQLAEITKVAATDSESQALSREWQKLTENHRASIKSGVERSQARAQLKQADNPTLKDSLRSMYKNSGSVGIDIRHSLDTTEIFVNAYIIAGMNVAGKELGIEANSKYIRPSEVFLENILKGIGSLPEKGLLKDLKLLEAQKAYDPRYIESSKTAFNLKTKWPGIQANVDFGNGAIYLAMDESSVSKLINFPES